MDIVCTTGASTVGLGTPAALGETPQADVSTCGSSDSRVGYACGVGSEGGEGEKGNRPPAVVWREGEVRGVGSAQFLEVEVVGLAVGFLVVEVVEAEELGLDFFGTVGKGCAGVAWDGDYDGLLGGEHLAVRTDDSLRPYAEYCGVDLGEGGCWGGSSLDSLNWANGDGEKECEESHLEPLQQ